MTSRRLHLRGRPNHPEDDPRPLKVMRARTLISSRTLARVISGPITSSARSRNDSGIFSPIALAVVRLMTSSNLVGCKTGRSAGFSPLRKIGAIGSF